MDQDSLEVEVNLCLLEVQKEEDLDLDPVVALKVLEVGLKAGLVVVHGHPEAKLAL